MRLSFPACVLCLFFAGCTVSTHLPAAVGNDDVLIHAPGWNGPVEGDREFLMALREGGCGMEMKTFDWTDGNHGLPGLWRAQHSAVPARELAAEIESLWRSRPGRGIYITADSCGCGVALGAIASLPPDVRVRTVILSSPAVSPGYDLRLVLKHMDDKLVSFNSDQDWFILGLGTSVFGTADNHRMDAAGKVGFTIPANDPGYAKFSQQTYTEDWRKRYGHYGMHAQALSPGFAKGVVVPLLLNGSKHRWQ